jgi:hypothetical protein
MAFENLTEAEKRVVLECLAAILEGPYINDLEFESRLGLRRAELNQVIAAWPNLDDSADDSVVTLAINNCLNEVCNGIDIPLSDWSKFFRFPKADIERTYENWARLKGYSSTGIR